MHCAHILGSAVPTKVHISLANPHWRLDHREHKNACCLNQNKFGVVFFFFFFFFLRLLFSQYICRTKLMPLKWSMLFENRDEAWVGWRRGMTEERLGRGRRGQCACVRDCVCGRACVRACVLACICARARARARVCVCVCVCVCVSEGDEVEGRAGRLSHAVSMM